jgi:putative two-component system response regulator
VYDALRSDRPYKAARSEDESLAIIEDEFGRHFDPKLRTAFTACAAEFREIRAELLHEASVSVPAEV